VIFGEEQIICDAVMTKLSATWIGMYVTGVFHDQFEVICGLGHMMETDAMTKYDVICG
jgi:hypothetical protein